MPSKGKSQQAVMGEELWEIIKELRTRKQGTDLSSFVAPASMMLPFSTTELLLLGCSACSAPSSGRWRTLSRRR